MKLNLLVPVFVDEIPRDPQRGKLYISCRYHAVIHLCPCGCATKISTPLHPTAWRLSYDGVSVSLLPSIGNWSEKCQSHYWITNNRVVWSCALPRQKIEQARRKRDLDLDRYYRSKGYDRQPHTDSESPSRKESWLTRLRKLISISTTKGPPTP